MSDRLDAEIDAANKLTRAMISEYEAWDSKIKIGEAQFSVYNDLLDFVNMRLETVESCLLLIDNQKIADALGLSRSLLENYLLFILMCRGKKFSQLRNMTSLKESEFKAFLLKERGKYAALRMAGETQIVDVMKAPRIARHLMYVVEGFKMEGEPSLILPPHYFRFRDFHPETMRLNEEDYFQYYKPEAELAKVLKGHQIETALSYKFYLSYDGLLEFLQLNEIIDESVVARIEAHYTFLGKFLHPTHDAARALHVDSNVHYGDIRVGMRQPYDRSAVLLASIYLCYLTASFLDEAAGLIEGAPAKYISQSGTDELRALTRSVPQRFPYFWFLFNEPPLYDRFNYCAHHATDDELREWGGYAGVPLNLVPSNQHIYSNFQEALGGWSNTHSVYVSPLRE